MGETQSVNQRIHTRSNQIEFLLHQSFFVLFSAYRETPPKHSLRIVLAAFRCLRQVPGTCRLFFVVDFARALRKFFEKLRVGDDKLVVVVVGDGAGMAQRQDDLIGGDAVHAEKTRDVRDA